MPKVASSTDEEVVKAPRKRAPRRTVASKEATTPRVRRTRAPKEERVAEVVETEVARKAPTRLPDTPSRGGRFSFKTAVKIIIPLVIIGTTLWIGFSDGGQIDVNAKISDRNNSIANSEGGAQAQVPVQNAPTVPNGGLVGQGVLNPPTNLVPVSQSTSTSSDTATTTVNVVEGENTASTTESTPAETESAETENPTEASPETPTGETPQLAS